MRRLFLSCGWAMVLAFGAPGQRMLAADKPAAREPRNPIDRWNQMSPEERERELAKLPPERARQIRERIRRYNQMPQREKQALREGYQKFSALPPERQETVRRSMRDFRQLPLDRRPMVRQEIDRLRALPEPQRTARVNSEDFRNQFSPRERQIIRDITEYLPSQLK